VTGDAALRDCGMPTIASVVKGGLARIDAPPKVPHTAWGCHCAAPRIDVMLAPSGRFGIAMTWVCLVWSLGARRRVGLRLGLDRGSRRFPCRHLGRVQRGPFHDPA
jgi:hypothetical protein